MCETAEALEAKLDDGEKELFEKFCNAQDDEGHLYQVETFIRGFRIAALMLFEVFAAGDADFISGKETE